MLLLSDLKHLVDWKPIAPGFGRDGGNTYEVKIQPIFREIEKLESAEVRVMGKGGLSNYASAFVHNRKNGRGEIAGLYVYLSLLAPIAAVGRDTAYITDEILGTSMIEPSAVLSASGLQSEFERSVWHAIEAVGFHLLSVDEATTALPADVVPYEYCLNNPPWDRVFHALFSDTD